MNAVANRLEFAPPPTAGLVRAIILALLAHAVLIAALTWGVRWKRDDTIVTAQAELWSAVPQQAAPKRVEVPPAPPRPPPPPAPVQAKPDPVTPKVPDADIALERDKQLRLQKEKQRAADKLEQDKRKLQAEQKKAVQDKQRELADKAEKADKADKAEKLALDKKKAEQDAKRKELFKAEDASKQAALAAQRADNLKRMAALAGSAGAPSATGTGLQNSGPSSGAYAGRLSAKVKANIVFTEELSANQPAEVEVRAAPDGTIVGRKLLKSSGSRAWDDAVLKAIDKMETLPRNPDGPIPLVSLIVSRPRD